jgi:hypothetical protein
VVATGVPGLILFEDSARRLFNDLNLPACSAGGGVIGSNDLTAPACIDGTVVGGLDLPGWPPAGTSESPITQIRVRSVGLVPGLPETAGASACQRLEQRQMALRRPSATGQPAATARASPRPAAAPSASGTAAILGEAFVREAKDGKPGPNPQRWITTLVIPADHPMVMAMRRDVNPEALQPDGLLGTAMFRDSDVVLDYTDGTPGVRVSCSDPDDGTMHGPARLRQRPHLRRPARGLLLRPPGGPPDLADRRRRLRLLRRPLAEHRRRAQQRRHRPRPPTTVRDHLFPARHAARRPVTGPPARPRAAP